MKIDWDRVVNLILWFLQGFLALAFLIFGATKFTPQVTFWRELFARIGIGQWLRYFTGGLEVAGAILLLVPRTSALAAALLAATMMGAILTHLFVLRDGYAAFFPAFTLLMLAAIAWGRWNPARSE